MIQDDDEKVNNQNVNPDILKISEDIAQYIPELFVDQIIPKNKIKDNLRGLKITFRTLYYDNLFVYVLILEDIDLDAIENEEEKKQRLLQSILTKILYKLYGKESLVFDSMTNTKVDILARRIALHSFDRIKSISTISIHDIV